MENKNKNVIPNSADGGVGSNRNDKTETSVNDKTAKEKLKAEKYIVKEKEVELEDIERYIIRKYVEAIEGAPEHFPKEITLEKIDYMPSNNLKSSQNKGNVKDKKESKITRRDRLDHYEKLYRCYIDSRRVRQTRWVIIAVAVVLIVTTICCAFGPNFKSQENTSTIATTTSSSDSVIVSGYADRDSYGYTYFQESNNGRR